MSGDGELVGVAGGMAAAACAPALVGALIGLVAGGPLAAVFVFIVALVIAAGHVMVLALPVLALLSLLGRRPGWATALVAAVLIGGAPVGVLIAREAAPWGAVFGLIGGLAFCAMSFVRPGRAEG